MLLLTSGDEVHELLVEFAALDLVDARAGSFEILGLDVAADSVFEVAHLLEEVACVFESLDFFEALADHEDYLAGLLLVEGLGQLDCSLPGFFLIG